jgi:hypothetical protein
MGSRGVLGGVKIIFGESSSTKGSTPVSKQDPHTATQTSRFALSNPISVRSLHCEASVLQNGELPVVLEPAIGSALDVHVLPRVAENHGIRGHGTVFDEPLQRTGPSAELTPSRHGVAGIG